MLGYANFEWRGDKLMLAGRNTGARIIPDAKWPGMWRVEYPPGVVSDMANLTRCKDAAIHIVAGHLNEVRKQPLEAPRTHAMRSSAVGVALSSSASL